MLGERLGVVVGLVVLGGEVGENVSLMPVGYVVVGKNDGKNDGFAVGAEVGAREPH